MRPTGSREPAVAADHLPERRRRADAERSIAAIVEAAFACLSEDPDASTSAIARAAGVGRVTLYSHFPSREALLAAVVERAAAQAAAALDAAAPDQGPAREALGRLTGPALRVVDPRRRLAGAAARDPPPPRPRGGQGLRLHRGGRPIPRGPGGGGVRDGVPRAGLVG